MQNFGIQKDWHIKDKLNLFIKKKIKKKMNLIKEQ
jgi:hypothetical protein